MAKDKTDVTILQAAVLDVDEIPEESLASLRKRYAAPVSKARPSPARKSCGRRKSCKLRGSCEPRKS
jgi:hypothetical protein